MRKLFTLSAALLSFAATSASAGDVPVIGVVNFASCITDSKAGKKEQENMEAMRKHMSSLIEESEKELKEISAKLEDPEYLDSLSPKAEEDLKAKAQSLEEDLARYQGQFYQVLQQTNYQIVQKMSGAIAKAAEKVAKEKKLDYVMNKEACFYIRPDLDVTTRVIDMMDESFDLESKSKKVSEADAIQNSADESGSKQAG